MDPCKDGQSVDKIHAYSKRYSYVLKRINWLCDCLIPYKFIQEKALENVMHATSRLGPKGFENHQHTKSEKESAGKEARRQQVF